MYVPSTFISFFFFVFVFCNPELCRTHAMIQRERGGAHTQSILRIEDSLIEQPKSNRADGARVKRQGRKRELDIKYFLFLAKKNNKRGGEKKKKKKERNTENTTKQIKEWKKEERERGLKCSSSFFHSHFLSLSRNCETRQIRTDRLERNLSRNRGNKKESFQLE